MKENEITKEYVEQIYNELGHYIIIGLTGRCGSGCSTTREILCGERKFNPEDYMGNIKLEAVHNSDRDKNVILNFADKNPLHFDAIKVRNILTSYILENTEAFFDLLNQIFQEIRGDGKKIKNDFYLFFNNEVNLPYGAKNQFDEVVKINSDIWRKITDNVYQFIEEINEEQYDFIFCGLDEISRVIRKFLNNYSENDEYTTVYQYVGSIVRTYGNFITLPDYNSSYDLVDINGVYAVVKRINLLLKIMRRKEWILNNYKKAKEGREKPIEKSSVHIVIDCIKNVFEAEYLKVRYHSFYLVALTLDDDIRKQRLKLKKRYSDLDMEVIDAREQISKAKKLIKEFNGIELKENKSDDKNERPKFKVDVYKKLFSNNNQCSGLYRKAYKRNTFMFTMQDVDGCIQSADILINNGGTKEALGYTITRYVSLMQHPGLVPPTIDERCMQVAQTVKLNSGCISRQVGAVISDSKGNILSVGWNDPASTEGNECISCIRRSFDNLICKNDEMAYSYYELNQPEFRQELINIMKKMCLINEVEVAEVDLLNTFDSIVKPKAKGVPLAFCFKDIYSSMTHDRNQVHTRAQHGEENALEACDKEKCSGGTLYTTSSSCELCAKKALGYNIKRIVYIEPYSGITNEHVLGHKVENGINVRRNMEIRMESMSVELFTGATQNAYLQLYSPVFPLKDELELRGIELK